MTGLIVMSINANSTTVAASDPSTGRTLTRRTFTAPAGVTANAGALQAHPGLVARTFFNSDFSLMAASGPSQPDGSSEAGVLDTNGRFTPLTAAAKGYSSPQRKVALGFDPTGRLWYAINVDSAYTGQFGSVDPSKGPSSARDEQVSPATLHAPNGDFTGVAFWVGTYGPIDAGALEREQQIVLPNGTEADEALNDAGGSCKDIAVPWGWQVGPAGTVTRQTPVRPVTNGCLSPEPTPVWPVSATSFLTTQGSAGFSNGATQIYYNTVSADRLNAVALLPDTDRIITSVVTDQAGTTAAFISQNGQLTGLYTVSLTPGGQPKQVASLPGDPGTSYTLLGWLQ